MEELLDTNVREKIDHPRRIGIVGILTACMTGVLGYAGESGAFENIHEIVMIIVIFGIPLLTSFLAIYAAFPKSLDQCKGLTNSIILTYSLLPFIYPVLMLLIIFRTSILSYNFSYNDLIEAISFFTLFSSIPGVFIASVIKARCRALEKRKWIYFIPLTTAIIVILAFAFYKLLIYLD